MESDKNKKQWIIVLLGPPGSGKGTQALRICRTLALPHISTGDLFRHNISTQTDLGLQAKSFINRGKLVPDEVVLEMLCDRLAQEDCKNGYLLDGFPRTIPQADALQKHLLPNAIFKVFNLEVSDDVVLKRISGRLSCSTCGRLYNRYFNPPKKESVCDKCGGTLYQREDDKNDVVQKRLKEYAALTVPLIQYYDQKSVLQTINGELGAEEVFRQIIDSLLRESSYL